MLSGKLKKCHIFIVIFTEGGTTNPVKRIKRNYSCLFNIELIMVWTSQSIHLCSSITSTQLHHIEDATVLMLQHHIDAAASL